MRIIILATLSSVIACLFAGCVPMATVDQPYPIRIGATQAELKGAIKKANQGKEGDSNCVLQKWVRVSAGFENGVCNRIKYVSNARVSSTYVSRVLSLNSRGVKWAIERTSKEDSKIYYRSCDLKYRAVLTNDRELFIVTDKCFQKTMKEVASEKEKSK